MPSSTPSRAAPVLDRPEPLDLAALLGRICVRPPYFALERLHLGQDGPGQGEVVAEVRAELPPGPELGPIQGAELSRHAAIAGLCAAALAQPDAQRRYYLAQRATYQGWLSSAPYGATVTLRAALLNLTRREATARIRADAGGRLLAEVEVQYTILTDSAFGRLFHSRERQTPSAPLPERMPLLPAGLLSRDADTWTRHIDCVPAEACAGHFERYPAMPVAILMGQLSQLAGLSLGGQPFWIPHATVEARDFCWAGEAVTFQARALSASGDGDGARHFSCQATASDRPVGQMHLTLQRGAAAR